VDIVTPPPVVSLSLGFAPQQASAAPSLQVGQIVNALVLALIDSETVRLSLPGMVLDAKTTVPLDPGTTVRLAVQGSSSALRLVIVGTAAGGAAASGGAAQTISSQPASDPMPSIVPWQLADGEGVASTAGQATIVDVAGLWAAPAADPQIAGAAPQPIPPAVADATRVAVADATRVAAARQGGLAPLLANVAQVVDARAAPRPVLQAAIDVLNLRVPLDDGLVAADVRQAAAQSGLFLEAGLAPPTGEGPPTQTQPLPQNQTQPPPQAQPDAQAEAAQPQAQAPAQAPAAAQAQAQAQAETQTQAETQPQAQALPQTTAQLQTPTRAETRATTTSGPPTAAGPPSAAPANLADIVLPSGDMKAALLVFREVLKVWLDQAGVPNAPGATAGSAPPSALGMPRAPQGAAQSAAAGEPAPAVAGPVDLAHVAGPPPPYRGDPPSAQPAAAPTLAAEAAAGEVAQQLLGQTEAALARHTLMQIASLPDQAHPAGSRLDAHGSQWLFEIPFMTPQGTSLAQFEIGRDGRAVTADGREIWRARFSLDVEPMGPVHVQVALLGERAAVTLWAERAASAAQLRESAPMLSEALRLAQLEPGEIQCRVGAPVGPRPAAGRFLDRAS
jgi:hypothetical protein